MSDTCPLTGSWWSPAASVPRDVSHTEAGNLLFPDGLVLWGICQPIRQVC